MKIAINKHSSIRIESEKVIYFDPYLLEEERHDADIIFITHDHGDHFSLDDIRRVEKEGTIYVIPENMYNLLGGENVVVLNPYEKTEIEGYKVSAVPSYNRKKPFHPKEKQNLGYIVEIENKKVYVAGDTDKNEDNVQIKADIALVPVGGHYTMDYLQAAELIAEIKPAYAIPTHYGSNGIGTKEDGEKFAAAIKEGTTVLIAMESEVLI